MSAPQLPAGALRDLLERHGLTLTDPDAQAALELDLGRVIAGLLASLIGPWANGLPDGLRLALATAPVRTADDLDSLAPGSAVIDQRGDLVQRVSDGDTLDKWEVPGQGGPVLVELPAVAVWVAS